MNTKEETLRRNFIIDEEIDLFEKLADDVQKKDLFNTTTYVNTLTNCALKAPDNKPFTIGLFCLPITNKDEHFEERVAITPCLSGYEHIEELHRV